MNGRRWLIVAIALSAAALTVGTTAFSATTLDRQFQLTVDEDSMVDLTTSDRRLANGKHSVGLVSVQHSFDEPVTITAEVSGETGAKPPKLRTHDRRLVVAPGDVAHVHASAVCSAADGKATHRMESWTVSVTVRTESVTVRADRTVTVECTGDPPAGSADRSSASGRTGSSSPDTARENEGTEADSDRGGSDGGSTATPTAGASGTQTDD